METLDCLIIGGGPAGLMGAVYLARYRRHVMVIENGRSRAQLIPFSHNFPGCCPLGISGRDILKSLREQAERHGVKMERDTVKEIKRIQDSSLNVFSAHGENISVQCKNIILATGMGDLSPPENIFSSTVDEFILKGLVKHCPVCDGYEVSDKKIAIFGHDSHGLKEALFLKTYSSHLTIFTLGKSFSINAEEEMEFKKANIHLQTQPVLQVEAKGTQNSGGEVNIYLADQQVHSFDALYLALGPKIHSELAIQLGAKHDSMGNLIVDKHQRTSIPGLYASGDLIEGLKQIVVAFAQSAIAATHIHHELGI